MVHPIRPLGPLVAALALATAPAVSAQTVHQIRLEHDAATHEYRFNPATITARAGDVLVFKVTGGGDHGIAFEECPLLGKEAMRQTRLLVNNPCEISESDAQRLYEAAW